jgi:hypothetical protein
MTKHSLDLPTRNVKVTKAIQEGSPSGGVTFPAYTEKQMDMIVKAKTEAFVQGAQDVGAILKGIVDIVKIRQQGTEDVKRLEAETSKIVQSTRVHIERLIQEGDSVRTRGEVVISIMSKMTEMLGLLDSAAQGKLIDSLGWLVQAALDKPQE